MTTLSNSSPAVLKLANINKAFSSDIDQARKSTLLRIFFPPASSHRVTHQVSALQDINLRLEPGERVLVAGTPGSGKTTLAKVAAGVFLPTQGQVHRTGRVQFVTPKLMLFRALNSVGNTIDSLIALTGCYPKQARQIRQETIALFALEGQLRQTVRDADRLMLRDLVAFVLCRAPANLYIFDDFFPSGRILETLPHLQESTLLYCTRKPKVPDCPFTRALILNGGKLGFETRLPEGAKALSAKFQEFRAEEAAMENPVELEAADDDDDLGAMDEIQLEPEPEPEPPKPLTFIDYRMFHEDQEVQALPVGAAIRFEFLTHSQQSFSGTIELNMAIRSAQGQRVLNAKSQVNQQEFDRLDPEATLHLQFPNFTLGPGEYRVAASVHVNGELVGKLNSEKSFRILPTDYYQSGQVIDEKWGVICLPYQWSLSPKGNA